MKPSPNLYRNKYFTLAILVVFFLIIRFLILLSSVAYIIYDDELGIGMLAKEIIRGPAMPLFEYADNYRWGGLVIGTLAAPFFILFGESLIVLRSVAMLFSLATLILLYVFLYKFFDKKTAVLTALLFILSPPNYTKMSLICWGSYTEINFFSILAIYVFYRIFFIREIKPRQVLINQLLYALFGIIAGFALFYDYLILPTLFSCILFWFVLDRRFFFKKNFYIFLGSFIIGFSPWFYYNLTHNWQGLFTIYDQSILKWYMKNNFAGSLIRLKNFFISDIPSYFSFKNIFFINGGFISLLCYLIFLVSLVSLLWLNRRSIFKIVLGLIPLDRFKVSRGDISRESFLIIYPIIFSVIYAFCGTSYIPIKEADIIFPHRFVTPLLPFIFITAGLFLGREKNIANKWFGLLTAVLISLGLISNLSLINIDTFRISFIPRGYNYVRLGKQMKWRYGSDVGRSLNYIKKIDKKDQRFCYDGYEWGIMDDESGYSIRAYVKKVIENIDMEYRPFASEKLGRAIGGNFMYNEEIRKELKGNLDEKYRPHFFRGMGRALSDKVVYEPDVYSLSIDKIDKEYWPYFNEGIGMELDEVLVTGTIRFIQFMNNIGIERQRFILQGLADGKEYREINLKIFGSGLGRIGYDIMRWNQIIDRVKEEFRPYFYQRLGIETGWRFIHDVKRYLKFLEHSDKKYWPYMYKGLGIGIGWRFGDNIEGCVQLIRYTDRKFWPYVYEGLGIGAARRYGYWLEEWTQEIAKVPADYNAHFYKGVEDTIMRHKKL